MRKWFLSRALSPARWSSSPTPAPSAQLLLTRPGVRRGPRRPHRADVRRSADGGFPTPPSVARASTVPLPDAALGAVTSTAAFPTPPPVHAFARRRITSVRVGAGCFPRRPASWASPREGRHVAAGTVARSGGTVLLIARDPRRASWVSRAMAALVHVHARCSSSPWRTTSSWLCGRDGSTGALCGWSRNRRCSWPGWRWSWS